MAVENYINENIYRNGTNSIVGGGANVFVLQLLNSEGTVLGQTLNGGNYAVIKAAELDLSQTDNTLTITFDAVDYQNTFMDYDPSAPGFVGDNMATHYRLSFLTQSVVGSDMGIGNCSVGEVLFTKNLKEPQWVNPGNQFNFTALQMTISLVTT